ncbi:MAG: hypothetical protein IAF38_13910 [Bacteroidia bacterium]|nr:hypothetical protein [Bacteroidia bacterium]
MIRNYKPVFFTKLLLAFLFVLGAGKSSAQNDSLSAKDSLKCSVHFGMFFANPVGVFGSVDNANAASGYSKTGFGLNAGYSYRIVKNLCIKADFSYVINSINHQKLASQIEKITEQQVGLSNITSGSREAKWKNCFLLGGISYQFWFGESKKLGLEPELLAGADYCITPDVVYSVRIDNLTFQTRNVSKRNFAFAHREALKINYLLGNRTLLSFNLGYCSAAANATGMEQIVTGNNSYSRTVNDYKINVSFVQVGFGICTRF